METMKLKIINRTVRVHNNRERDLVSIFNGETLKIVERWHEWSKDGTLLNPNHTISMQAGNAEAMFYLDMLDDPLTVTEIMHACRIAANEGITRDELTRIMIDNGMTEQDAEKHAFAEHHLMNCTIG